MTGSFRGLGHRGLVLAVLLVVVVVAAPASAAPPPAINQFQFSPNLQFGGRSPAVAIDPFDNTIAIAGSESGGLDRTTDGGQTWSHLSFPQFVIGDVRYDPQDATRVIATSLYDGRSTPQSGIWRSTDGASPSPARTSRMRAPRCRPRMASRGRTGPMFVRKGPLQTIAVLLTRTTAARRGPC